MSVLKNAIGRSRATICVMALIVIAGIVARMSMTIEASPTPSVPIVFVVLSQDGISPEDGARLLVRPMEKELRSLEGLKEIRSTSRETVSYVIVEFEADINIKQAVQDVRSAVDRGKSELPAEAEEPSVEEVSANDTPTIIVTISGEAGERIIYQAAQQVRRGIETIPDVLEANLRGSREEVVQATIDPARLEHYGITSVELYNAINNNNLLIPAGQLDTGEGRFAVKVPGLIETKNDVAQLPLRVTTDGAVTLGDIALVNRTFKDASQYTSVNGVRAMSIEVKKRNDANDIEVTKAVRAVVEEMRSTIPSDVKLDFLMDQSEFSLGMINEMQGNILTAMVLVMIIVVAALGFRSGILVGAGVPFSLLFSAIIIQQLGYSFNFMVLFGMLLALGMLIDGAIVVVEFADRKMAEGLSSSEAYQIAAKRMLWPVIASTSTTLAAFLPIMFWPGVAGEFMRYLPVTVFAVLVGSLLYALLFAPVLGALLGRNKMQPQTVEYLKRLESELPYKLPGITGKYARILSSIVHHPFALFCGAFYLLIGIFLAFSKFNAGVEFFVKTEQVQGFVTIRAQGNLSVDEGQDLAAEVEQIVNQVPGVKVAYSTVDISAPQQVGPRAPEKDQIGTILVETYTPEEMGRSTHEVYAEIRRKTEGMAGIIVNAIPMDGGPPVGKPVQVQLESVTGEHLIETARRLRKELEMNIAGLRDVTDTTPLPGIEWSIEVDRVLAAQLGASVLEVGRSVQLVTNGIKIGEYRPDDADDEVDIRIRYPESFRGLQMLDKLMVNTTNGPVAVSTFVKRVPKPKVDKISRIDGKEYVRVLADVEEGVLADDKVKEIEEWLADHPVHDSITVTFRGANEEQNKSFAFLMVAFALASFLMFILLVTQFNSFYQAFLTLSAVFLSTAGVFLGLTLTQSTFSVIMTGVGIVALAGIVVNNNIVLIDTFNYIRATQIKYTVKEATVIAATQRLRPVFLTTATTILGLMPLAMGVSVDMLNRTVVYGGVVGSYWIALASAIVYGLIFSTVLTLLITPALLVLPSEVKILWRKYIYRPFKHYRQERKKTVHTVQESSL
ncbi:efflux RND transporter permease subunit [Agarilytica rhodophyticola]|uniref:efflux RND transporter permease subunit n=1 Tax=Agarilytica rhodophyticola TaxID=1737490 RepID=UPI000B34364E|nr:efflux RND transporter permease subunit [Agarilytica rhodophyticola]